MMLKAPKKKGGRRTKDRMREGDDEGEDEKGAAEQPELEPGSDDPLLSIPMPRYNAMLAVLRNTLYMYVFVYLQSFNLEANSND
jgi:hypothetical protein